MLQSEHFQISRTGHQRTVIVIYGIAQCVIIAIYLSTGFQKLHLVSKPPVGKHADSLFCRSLRATEGHVHVYDFLHALANLVHILIRQQFVVLLLEVTIVATRQRVLHEQLRTGKQILRSFVKEEAQTPDIHTMTTACTGIQKFHVAVLVKSELQSLRHVIHLCRHHRVGQLYLVLKLLVNVQQRGSFRETLCHVVVLAAYL